MKTAFAVLAALSSVFCLARPLHAGTVVITGSTTDAGVTANLQLDGGSGGVTFRAGETASSGFGRAGVWVFKLPSYLNADDIVIVGFSVGLVSITGAPSFNGDLYGLGATVSDQVKGAYYYNGTLDTSSGVSLLQDNFVTSSTSTGEVSANASGGTALTSYIVGQLNAGAAGKYVFIRISPDLTSLVGEAVGYNFATANNTTDGVALPTLTITTATAIPEPLASVTLAGLAAIGAACLLRGRAASRR